jgi:hypothetical protein
MHELQRQYPYLDLFGEMPWHEVTEEYQSMAIEMSFPEYLQHKSIEGECPAYFFELAFYQLALEQVRNADPSWPLKKGLWLNPTAHFLSLEFDIPEMISNAKNGRIEVIHNPKTMGICLDQNNQVRQVILTPDELRILAQIENEIQIDIHHSPELEKLIQSGIIIQTI